ncbi:hypothetical protein CYFUS_008383 [Cystobacter fuscus]|uniref:Uncharacterized protein n=1 Tax=Cystobacter fuscus TaxID=43 RepID=A0A250JG80_9BACT|nr:hypothetical protein [Cystobacter fuscus]ATB42904.1 hypothetical protein CYFUS_008383 [Cystobacter fuscus]
MRSYQTALAVVLLAGGLFAGGNVSHAADSLPVPPDARNFIQPFFLIFDRNEEQVIVFLANHPVYEAIEVMVTRRAGQQPLLRVIITRHDTDQIDHINDVQLARERAALLPERKTVYRPILYEQSEVAGIVTSRLRFKSYRGEDIDLHFQALAPVSVAGRLIATEHAREEALPVLWSNASAFASPETRLTIDGVSYPLRPGPQPGSLLGVYSAGFLLGVVYEASLELYPLRSPRRLAEGEKWVYLDNLGNQHVYEIIDVAGEQLTIHKTTTSPTLTEEFITVQREGNGLQLRTVRATGRGGEQVRPGEHGRRALLRCRSCPSPAKDAITGLRGVAERCPLKGVRELVPLPRRLRVV